MLFCVMLSFIILQAAEVYLSVCVCEGLCAGGLATQRELRVQSVVNEKRFVCACECTCLGWVLWGRGEKKEVWFDLPPTPTNRGEEKDARARTRTRTHTHKMSKPWFFFQLLLLFCLPVCVWLCVCVWQLTLGRTEAQQQRAKHCRRRRGRQRGGHAYYLPADFWVKGQNSRGKQHWANVIAH